MPYIQRLHEISLAPSVGDPPQERFKSYTPYEGVRINSVGEALTNTLRRHASGIKDRLGIQQPQRVLVVGALTEPAKAGEIIAALSYRVYPNVIQALDDVWESVRLQPEGQTDLQRLVTDNRPNLFPAIDFVVDARWMPFPEPKRNSWSFELASRESMVPSHLIGLNADFVFPAGSRIFVPLLPVVSSQL